LVCAWIGWIAWRQFERANRRVGYGLIVTFTVIAILGVLWLVPQLQVASLNGKGVAPEDIFTAENAARATLAQILGGGAILIGLYFAWQNIAATKKTLDLTKEGQITERFTKAIEQLGSDKLEIRLGGIYALERIARDSARDHEPVAAVLSAFVREHARRAPDRAGDIKRVEGLRRPAGDVQAILSVLGRL